MKMIDKFSNEIIKNNFNNAAQNYLYYSSIQKYFSKRIVNLIKNLEIPKGDWYDLGSGTGFLADLIEGEFSQKKVTRVDFSTKMLLKNKNESKKLLWDLNDDLPLSNEAISLFVSNFCLHWLDEPKLKLKKWFNQLVPGGYLIVSVPTNKCFYEWRLTCEEKNIEYSGINFLKPEELTDIFLKDEIISQDIASFKEEFNNIFDLFRNIINMGAQYTPCDRKTVRELRLMQNYWPRNKNKKVTLTWEICILILKKI
tara:strand:- start:582 stop:1346 length:765 start_codon:yes stop_codon:yes gene_type:complete